MHAPRWQDQPAAHQIRYADPAALQTVLDELRQLPPLVSAGEIEELRAQVAAAQRGEAFILQAGDCVERFSDCRAERIADRLTILLQMSVILTWAARTPVVRIGRMAGQYFKPRSAETEPVPDTVPDTARPDSATGGGSPGGEARVLTYRGDPVHGFPRDQRTPDPRRLRDGYFHAAATLNHIRAMIAGGFADLHHPERWDLAAIHGTRQWQDYRQVAERITEAIAFMESFGGADQTRLGDVSFYTSHEALHLPYEDALTRDLDGEQPAGSPAPHRLNQAAHTVWLGARTADPDGAHVAYLAGIANPIGIKVGPGTSPDALLRLLDRLNPDHRDGRIMLITRLGAAQVSELLPPLIRAVGGIGHPVVWMVDPMHGNTFTASGGHKTRRFEDILTELRQSFAVHRSEGSSVGGVHVELTADNVTECLGGAVDLSEADLGANYQSWCDPRLNDAQAMEIAFLLADLLRG